MIVMIRLKSAMPYPVLFMIACILQGIARAQQPKPLPLKITHLAGDFYVYETWKTISSGPYPSNSMYLVTKDGAVLFDTPWDSTQFQPLLDTIWQRHHKRAIMCIATHF